MFKILRYPAGDPRQNPEFGAVLPHESVVKIVDQTEHCVVIEDTKTGEQHFTHQDFLYAPAKTPARRSA